MTVYPAPQKHRFVQVPDEARVLRPAYFDRLDALLASGAFAVEDRRKTHPPTDRLYAE
ncbi:hypothetical protein [Nocardioides ochotonae]|uniref:hypothetical protein n=1 Tax=Nocardioides ochotonae TaxID=2685869 RepID=UPI001407EE74|nr:hypothetical protein [Nocardioides ochotonae]